MTRWSDPGYRSGSVVFGVAFTLLGLGTVGSRLWSWAGTPHDVNGLVLGILQTALGVGTLIWLHRLTKRARDEERSGADDIPRSSE
ncbi:hypothetical protein [Plantibacter flavus]|uniref:hypothetical protein n=1 Tax=Plantibacter flavus TaxID=150123 RepID=UPI0010C234C5|nr:hypothetical protein [Plantibacter flavus]